MTSHGVKRGARHGGVTLIELMITLAIVAILAAVVYPSYTAYLYRTNRSLAQGALHEAASRQETYFLNRKRYANDMRELGYPTNPGALDSEGQYLPVLAGEDFIYQIRIDIGGGAAYLLTATPNSPKQKDPACNVLTLTSTGRKGVSGATQSVQRCW
jgi:type IV pilus assembly protein PilE